MLFTSELMTLNNKLQEYVKKHYQQENGSKNQLRGHSIVYNTEKYIACDQYHQRNQIRVI